MAGLDDELHGEARLSPGFTVGYLSQEPHLDETKDVMGNVMDGVGEVADLLDRYDAVLAVLRRPRRRLREARRPPGRARGQDRRRQRRDDLERTIEIAMDALRCPPGDADVTKLSGGERRRVALCRCCCPSPTCCCSTSPPTTSTPSRSPGSSASSRTTRAPSSPSPTTATSSTTSPAGSSSSTAAGASPSRATTRAGWSRSRKRLAQERSEDRKPTRRTRDAQRELEWIAHVPKARQAKGRARISAYEELRRARQRPPPPARSWRS
jgi:energy-dependent translational throttle protein EttA